MRKFRTTVISMTIVEDYEFPSVYADHIESMDAAKYVEFAMEQTDTNLPYDYVVTSDAISVDRSTQEAD